MIGKRERGIKKTISIQENGSYRFAIIRRQNSWLSASSTFHAREKCVHPSIDVKDGQKDRGAG
jgi:hypothetical protein